MQTIQLQIGDDIYDELKSKGIDINHKLQHFLYDLLDDGFQLYLKMKPNKEYQMQLIGIVMVRESILLMIKSLPMRWKSIYKVFNICK